MIDHRTAPLPGTCILFCLFCGVLFAGCVVPQRPDAIGTWRGTGDMGASATLHVEVDQQATLVSNLLYDEALVYTGTWTQSRDCIEAHVRRRSNGFVKSWAPDGFVIYGRLSGTSMRISIPFRDTRIALVLNRVESNPQSHRD